MPLLQSCPISHVFREIVMIGVRGIRPTADTPGWILRVSTDPGLQRCGFLVSPGVGEGVGEGNVP